MLNEIPQAQSRGSIVRRSGTSVNQFDLFVTDSATVVGHLYDASGESHRVTSSGSGPFPLQQWTHVAMSFLDNTLALYVNGDQTDTAVFNEPVAGYQSGTPLDTLSILMGSYWNTEDPLSGRLDEVRISGIGRQWWEFNVNMARFAVHPDSLDFDHVLIGSERSLKLWITNPGIEILSVSDISSSNDAYVPDRTDFFVSPGNTELLNVSFAPPDTFFQAGILTLVTNDPFVPEQTLIMTGEGVDDIPVIAYDPDPFTSALYPLDEGTGSTAGDSSGNAMHGTISGGSQWLSEGRFSRALRLNGVNGRISVPYDDRLTFSRSDFSIEFWFSILTLPAEEALLVRRGAESTAQFELALDPAEGLMLRIWDRAGEERSLTMGLTEGLNTGQWYHTAFSWDGDSLRLYLNNELSDADTLTGELRGDMLRLIVFGGDTLNQNSFHGDMDEIRISSIARLPWEIRVQPREVEVYPTVLHFATVLVNQSRTLRFWVSNLGDQDLLISEISGAEGVFSIPDSLETFTLPRLSSQMVPVTYRPDGPDTTHQGEINIVSNDPSNPSVSIDMEGSGTEWAGPPPPPSVDTHTLALFRFAEASGDTILDATLNANNGSLFNGVTRTGGFFGMGLYFDGMSGLVRIPYQEDLAFDFEEESFTVEFYFRTDTVSQSLLAMGQEAALNYGIFIDNTGRISVEGFGSGGPRVNDNSWHHLAFSYNHITLIGKLYIDGSLIWAYDWIDPGTDPVTRPLIIGALEVNVGIYTQFFQGYIDEIRFSNIVREPWEFQLVDYGISVPSLNPYPVQLGTALTLDLHIPLELEASSIVLYFRAGGESDYLFNYAESINDTTYQALIPASAVTLSGLEYYVGVISGSDTIRFPGIDPIHNPVSLPVRHSGLSAPFRTQSRTFRLLSIPFLLDTMSVHATLIDDFGEYDPYNWRLFYWNDADSMYEKFTETTPDNYFPFEPGQAYWIITDQQLGFDIGTGQSVDTDSSFQIRLLPGWNHIGNPFYFAVNWADFSVSSDSVSTLYAYDPLEGYRLDWSRMEPWEGYWIHNGESQSQSLSIPPKRAQETIQKSIPGSVLEDMESTDWMIRFSAVGNRLKDLDNYIGVRRDGSNSLDRRDRFEPPSIEDRITVYFSSPDVSGGRRHAADIREPGQEGYVWALHAKMAPSDDQMTLTWSMIQDLPEDWGAFLFDAEEEIAVDLLKEQRYTVSRSGEGREERVYILAVGSQDFIISQSNGIPLVPCDFGLSQNYPNPFNPETLIPYSLPKRGRVELIVYNVLGQKIRILYEGMQRAGHHQIIWNGRDDFGRPVPNGVYICRLKGMGRTASQKMIVLK